VAALLRHWQQASFVAASACDATAVPAAGVAAAALRRAAAWHRNSAVYLVQEPPGSVLWLLHLLERCRCWCGYPGGSDAAAAAAAAADKLLWVAPVSSWARQQEGCSFAQLGCELCVELSWRYAA